MTAHATSASGYSQSARALGTPRSIELHVFSQITGRMTRAAKDDGSFPDLAAALHDNLSLWTTVTADVADSRNGLPASLRAQLVYLAEFTRSHTRKILRREADVGPLIEINTSVIRGLRAHSAP